MTYGGTTYGGAAVGSTSDPTILDGTLEVFRVIRDANVVEDAVYDVAPLVDTANPFGDYVVIKMDDRDGEKFEEYARGTRVDVEIARSTTSTIERFTGYVVERRESEQEGADALELEAYSFDQFLRRNTVTNDQRGNTITEALADIIDVDTPVSYDASNVDVGDDQELTRAYQGEAVENVLRDLAFKSNNEDFGVNDDLEFFFRQRETTHIDRGIDNTQWFRYDIPELGKEAINEVEVWFDDGEESVIVDDGTDKLDLQDSLNLPEPGTQRAELNRPLITDIGDAEDIGRKYLAFKNATLSGTVTTFGLYDAEPGDTIDVTIDPRGIDTEFVIAAIRYRWGVDETELTIVEKRGDVDDILSELSDSVQRVEMNGANRDAPKNRITTTNASAVVGVDVDADGNTPDADRFVNDGRRAVRDAWTGDAAPDIDTIAVGTDGGGLSRSNDALRNQTASASATQALPDATTVAFEATLTETGVEEVGLLAADGTLIARATFETAVDIDGTVTVTLGVDNDDSVSRGVLTTAGQTAVRDVLADASPTLPNAYAYGDDGTAVAESDTGLGNELVDVSLEEILIQDADTTAEWDALVDIAADEPLSTAGDQLGTLQSATVTRGVDRDRDSGNLGFQNDDAYINGTAILLSTSDQFLEIDVTPAYDIPASRVGIAIRYELIDATDVDITFNGSAIDDIRTGGAFALEWYGPGAFLSGREYDGGDLTAGETYTLRIETTSSTAEMAVDAASIFDTDEYPAVSDWDAEGWNAVHEPGGHLDGPYLYPETKEVAFATAGTRRNVTEANFTSTWNDTSGGQFVELANDGSTFTRVSNSDTGSVTFASPDRGVDARVGLDNWGSRNDATPRFGFDGQAIDTWMLDANPSAVVPDNVGETLTRAIVPPNTLSAGTTLREAGLKSDSTLLTRHILAEFSLLEGQRLASAESTLLTSDN